MKSSSEGWALPSLEEMPPEPKWFHWARGGSLYRVFPRGANPLWMNPNIGTDPSDVQQGGRFHPFESVAGTRVPTAYGASSLKAALGESVFHDLSSTPARHPRVVSMAMLARCQFAVLSVTADIDLIDLTGAGADRVRMPNELISWCLREDYVHSRGAARLLHEKYPLAHGIRWTSRRYPPADCVVIFGDRVAGLDAVMRALPPERRDFHVPGTEGYDDLEAVLIEADITPAP